MKTSLAFATVKRLVVHKGVQDLPWVRFPTSSSGYQSACITLKAVCVRWALQCWSSRKAKAVLQSNSHFESLALECHGYSHCQRSPALFRNVVKLAKNHLEGGDFLLELGCDSKSYPTHWIEKSMAFEGQYVNSAVSSLGQHNWAITCCLQNFITCANKRKWRGIVEQRKLFVNTQRSFSSFSSGPGLLQTFLVQKHSPNTQSVANSWLLFYLLRVKSRADFV